MRRVSARGALLPSRGQAWNHAHIFLIGRRNVRIERAGEAGVDGSAAERFSKLFFKTPYAKLDFAHALIKKHAQN